MSEPLAFFRALADETRWRIVRLVADRAMCVCELADILEMPQSSVSSHVQIIRKAEMLESETCGKWTYFRIARGHPFANRRATQIIKYRIDKARLGVAGQIGDKLGRGGHGR